MTHDDLPRVEQLGHDDLADLDDDELLAAHRAGKLNKILGAPAPVDYDAPMADGDDGEPEHVVTREDLRRMDPGEIVRLHATGRLDHLLRPNRS